LLFNRLTRLSAMFLLIWNRSSYFPLKSIPNFFWIKTSSIFETIKWRFFFLKLSLNYKIKATWIFYPWYLRNLKKASLTSASTCNSSVVSLQEVLKKGWESGSISISNTLFPSLSVFFKMIDYSFPLVKRIFRGLFDGT